MTSRRQFLGTFAFSLAATSLIHRNVFASAGTPRDFDVRKFGAVGDGVAVETEALQRAIDTAAQNGGGRVLIPGGNRFLTGALLLRSGVDFHLADDAMLLANPDPQDYGSFVTIPLRSTRLRANRSIEWTTSVSPSRQ